MSSITRFIKHVGGEARNSLAVVETRAVHCQSVIYRNGAADFEVTKADAAAINYSEFAALVVTGTALAREPSRSATMKAMALAHKAGLVLIIDIDYRPYSWTSKGEARDVCLTAAELSHIIVGNDEEFAVLGGAEDGRHLAQQMAAKPSRIVVYKMGENGAITFSGGTSFETPVFAVSALKPTGAGDGFMGGFISGLVAGNPLPQAVKRGAATAALVVTRVGCAPAMPNTAEVLSFIKQRSA